MRNSKATLLLAACALTALPVSSSSAALPSSVPALTSRVMVASDSTRYMRVTLPADVDMDGIRARLSGAGRLVAFALVQDQPGARAGGGAQIFRYRLRMCNGSGCSSGPTRQTPLYDRRLRIDGQKEILPAGSYRLYLAADGAEARLHLSLGGLSTTTTTLRPTVNPRAQVISPDIWYEESTGNSMMSAGLERPFSGRGLAFIAMWHRGDATAGSVIGDCEYEGRPPQEPQVAYAPGCPAAHYGRPATTEASVDPYLAYRTISYSYLPRSIGMYYVTPGAVSDAGVISFWLTFKS